MKYLLLSLVLFFKGDDPMQPLQKLKGTWKMQTKYGALYEEWKIVNSDILKGRTYQVNGKDTMVVERTELSRRGLNIFFTPAVEVMGQSQPPVPFMLISHENDHFIFENKGHDYPQQIFYRFVTADSLVAGVNGTENGRQKSSEYYYKKIK